MRDKREKREIQRERERPRNRTQRKRAQKEIEKEEKGGKVKERAVHFFYLQVAPRLLTWNI